MNTSYNHLREPGLLEAAFIRARGYLHDLSNPEKEVLLSNLGVDSGKIKVENFPDEEDLTQKMQGNHNVLKFKDKIFNPEVWSGMGKVFLRKNLVKDVNCCGKNINILTQDMFEDEHGLPLINTMFIIQYDYDLDKGFITIPENSALVFAGGSFRNGTVMLKNTLILPAALDIEHFMSVNIRGTYREGSLVYLRKHLRLFNGKTWVNLEGIPEFDAKTLEFLRNVDNVLDIICPFKITIIPEKDYLEGTGERDIKVSWNYNRIINDQNIRLMVDSGVGEDIPLDMCRRSFVFKNVDPNNKPVTIIISTTYKGRAYSEAIKLTFNNISIEEEGIKLKVGNTELLLDETKLQTLITKLNQ